MKQMSLALLAISEPKFWEPTTTAIPASLTTALANVPFKPTSRGWLIDVPVLSEENYKAFRRILTALRGRYEVGGRHLVDFDASDLLAEILEAGKLPKLNPYQLHQTPAAIVSTMLELCPIDFLQWKVRDGQTVRLLEPSAGLAAIAEPLRAILPEAQLDLFEIDYFNQQVLTEKGFFLAGCNWLTEAINVNYDLIVMNPEFRGEAYLKHIEKAYDCLKVGGFLATIVPVGFLSSKSVLADNLRETFAEQDWTVEPIGSPFEGVDIECLIVYGERLSQSDIKERRRAAYDGYQSRLHRASEIFLDSDRAWYESSQSGSVDDLNRLAADHLLRLMSEGLVLLPRSAAVCKAIAISRHEEIASAAQAEWTKPREGKSETIYFVKVNENAAPIGKVVEKGELIYIRFNEGFEPEPFGITPPDAPFEDCSCLRLWAESMSVVLSEAD